MKIIGEKELILEEGRRRFELLNDRVELNRFLLWIIVALVSLNLIFNILYAVIGSRYTESVL